MHQPLFSILSVLAGLSLSALQDVAVKAFSDTFSMLQILFLRSLIALIPLLLASMLVSGLRGVVPGRPGLAMARGGLGFLAFTGYYMAIAELPLARVVAIVFAAPILVTALSALFLKEKVGWRRSSAVCVGFLGVVVITGPSSEPGATLPTTLALLSALAYACSNIVVRIIGPADSGWSVSLWAMGMYVLLSGLLSLALPLLDVQAVDVAPAVAFLVRPWGWPSEMELLILLGLGLNAAFGFYFLTRAYLTAPASLVAPFEYSYIAWAALFGYLFWNEVPSPTTVLGSVLLIGSGLYVLHREVLVVKRGGREATAQPPPLPAARQATAGTGTA